MKKRIICLLLCALMIAGAVLTLASCGGGSTLPANKEALVIMTENLDGLFNPFFSTSATDGTIVSMTQIGMLTSKVNDNGDAEVAYGENEAVVTKDFEIKPLSNGDTQYTFVIKNGIKFSDGHPLTIEDVLFNLYVYLDPVYTGSATIYSTDIKGLNNYRTQTITSGDSDDSEDMNAELASSRALERIQELIDAYETVGETNLTDSYDADEAKMREYLKNEHIVTVGYMNAVAPSYEQAGYDFNSQLVADYDNALTKFKAELERDYASAKDSFTEEPYKSHEEFQDEIFCFMYMEGYVTVEYEKKEGTNKDDYSKIKSLKPNYTNITTKEQAINRVYNDTVRYNFPNIVKHWATAQELQTEFAAKAKEVILHENISEDGLIVENIEGIVSLGHDDATKGSTITVNGNSYTVASAHDENGVPTDGYDVLQITINGVDPKAQWNFAFTVAPQHYYGDDTNYPVDIENNKFGVAYGSFDFMKTVIQSQRNIKLPMGAGAYKVTDRSNSDNPSEGEFYKDNVVYFKANSHFDTVGEGISNAKIEKLRYQVVSANNAIAALENGSVHFITPQLTNDNYDKIEALKEQGAASLSSQQLGYGYIGINASRVPNLNIRKAIMYAMNTALALDYYRSGTAEQIYWPMSTVSWAYPTDGGAPLKDNFLGYPKIGTFNEAQAKSKIQQLMGQAGVSEGDSALEITFTIAGSNLQDHPTYKTFRDAAALLNDLGWNVTVEPDTQALTKINTGSLDVWAAAWGSTIDPDMYQVYHKNSTATSTNAWGYSAIKQRGGDELEILNDLSDLIDDARETNEQDIRKDLYQQAMTKVLELCVELPVYQRSVLYAYNANVINPDSLPSEVNPYTSPLDRIWEIEFTA